MTSSEQESLDEGGVVDLSTGPGGAARLQARVEELESVLRAADKLAEAGLCCFQPEAMRGYLRDVRRLADRAGCRGGLTDPD